MKRNVSSAIYTRVSTENQTEIEYNSCESQKEKIEHFIKSQDGFRVYDLYNDEGYSGKDLNRPAMQRMLRDIETGLIDCVIAYKIDRLTRAPKDFYQLIEYFEKYNVTFISVTERFDTSTPAGRLLRNIMLTFAQFERELASERTKDKMLQRAGKGMWNGGVVPFGYKSVDNKLVVDPKQAKLVKDMFQMYIERRSITEIYNHFNNNGLTHKNGQQYTKGFIYHALRNRIYTGKVKYEKKLYDGLHEPIISEETFNLAQSKHRIPYKKLRAYREYLFGGIVRCKECGSMMTPSHVSKKTKGKKKRYYYYRCTKTYKGNWDSCNTKEISAKRLEKFVFDTIKRSMHDKYMIDNIIDQINNIGLTGSYTEANKLKMTDHSRHEKVHSCSRLEPEIFRRSLNMFVSAAEKTTPSETKELVRRHIKNIQFSKDNITIHMYYIPQHSNEEGSLGHVAGEHTPDPKLGCAERINTDDKITKDDLRGYRPAEGSGVCGPRRSAEGRSAGGQRASEASAGAAEGVRLGGAERSSRAKKKPDYYKNNPVSRIRMAPRKKALAKLL